MEHAHLRTYDSYTKAHIVKAKLESEGLHVVLLDENVSTQTIIPTIENMGIRLAVPMVQAEQALSIIEELEKTD